MKVKKDVYSYFAVMWLSQGESVERFSKYSLRTMNEASDPKWLTNTLIHSMIKYSIKFKSSYALTLHFIRIISLNCYSSSLSSLSTHGIFLFDFHVLVLLLHEYITSARSLQRLGRLDTFSTMLNHILSAYNF